MALFGKKLAEAKIWLRLKMEVLQRTANRGSVSTGFDVANSVKFDKGNDTTTVEFFERNVSSAGSRTIGTFSAWIKKTDVTTAQYLFTFGNVDNDDGRTFARFQTDGTLRVAGGSTTWRNTNRVFRDASAWYHIVIAFDTTQSTANNRIKVYVNGVQETSFSTTNNPSEDGTLGLNFGKQAIGYNTIDNNSGFNGYMCEVVIQDGVASAPTEFGEFDSASGIWIPKDASGATMGTNGTYLKFENASSMGAATAGNAFTVQNINQADQSTDTCSNNFCIWNILWDYASYPTFSQGATKVRIDDSTDESAKATIGLTNGKWYWEAKPVGTIGSQFIGIQTDGDSNIYANANGLSNNYTMAIEPQGRYYSYAGSLSESSAGQFTALSTSDWLGIALDMDSATQTIKYYANGSLILTRNLISEMQGQTVFPFLCNYENRSFDINFGGYTVNTISSAASDANGYGTFEYAPPSGYYALCTKNLAEYG